MARTIERIGQTRFGSGWSYNAAAFNTGRLYEGQPLTRRGTHTVNTFRRDRCPVHGGDLTGPITSSGYNLNVNTRALVLPQQVEDPVTDAQLDAAARWAAAQLRAGLAEPGARWHGHRCVTAKACPGQAAYDRIDELQALTDHYVQHGLQEDDMTPEELLAHRITVTRRDGIKTKKSIEALLRETWQRTERVDEDAIAEAVAASLHIPVAAGTVDPEQIKMAVKDALREGTGD